MGARITVRNVAVVLLLAGMMGGLMLALFWPATGLGYINLDDHPYVVDNPTLRSGDDPYNRLVDNLGFA